MRSNQMLTFDDVPQLLVGIMLTAIAGFKLYGLSHGIIGGGKKPVMQRLCGT
jgi:hypothetical protein